MTGVQTCALPISISTVDSTEQKYSVNVSAVLDVVNYLVNSVLNLNRKLSLLYIKFLCFYFAILLLTLSVP